jgi:hypothetical protein
LCAEGEELSNGAAKILCTHVISIGTESKGPEPLIRRREALGRNSSSTTKGLEPVIFNAQSRETAFHFPSVEVGKALGTGITSYIHYSLDGIFSEHINKDIPGPG